MVCGNLAHRLVDRKVPGREGRDRANRLFHHQLLDSAGARRNDPAIGAPPFFRHPIDDVGADARLHPHLGQRLTLLQGHQLRHLFGAFAQQVSGAAHHLGALIGGDPAPRGEAFGGGLQRRIEIGAPGVRHPADHFLGRWIYDRDGTAVGGLGPGAVDAKQNIGIHRATPVNRSGNGTPAGAHRSCRSAWVRSPRTGRPPSSIGCGSGSRLADRPGSARHP